MGRTAARPLRAGQRLRLSNVDWRTYTRLLHALADRPGVRLTYDRGELEIMSPSLRHDDDGTYLGHMVRILTEEVGLPIRSGGSTTLRRRLKQRGLEPDECFWIAHAPQMAGVRRLDLRIHPPPDLAIEVDVTRSSLDRMGVYTALGVPEVWRLDGDALSFHALGADGTYQQVGLSLSFPNVAPDDLMNFLRQARQAADQNEVTRRFRAWVRQRHAP